MADKKRIATTIGAMALAATLAVGGTLAYLQKVTDTKVNAFTSSNNVVPELNEVFNEDEARNYTPGDPVTKQPSVKNVSSEKGENMIAGMAVQYTVNGNTAATKAEFDKYAAINVGEGNAFDATMGTDWSKAGVTDNNIYVYMYGNILGKGASTSNLFDSVTVRGDIVEYLLWENYGNKDVDLYYIDPDAKDADVAFTQTETKGGTKYTSKYVKVSANKDEKAYMATVNNHTKYYTATVNTADKTATDITEATVTLPSIDIRVTGLAIQTEGFATGNVIDTTKATEALTNLAATSIK